MRREQFFAAPVRASAQRVHAQYPAGIRDTAHRPIVQKYCVARAVGQTRSDAGNDNISAAAWQRHKENTVVNEHAPTAGLIRIVDPAAEVETENNPIAARLKSLRGARIAIIDNTKHMANSFLDATRALLEEKYQIAGFEYYRKFSASVPTPPDVIARLTNSCDAVIHGVAD